MASFDRSTSTLWFRHRSTGQGPEKPRTALILWPMFGWRVLAPQPRPRELNLAQKAVLGMLEVGLKLDPIAEQLALDRDLTALVILELAQLGLADILGQPTAKGLAALERERLEPEDETVVGWVFSDACTGKVWPAFVAADLPVAATELDAEGWQQLVPSRGSGKPYRAFTMLPKPQSLQLVRPRDVDVLAAARSQRRRDRFDDVPLADRTVAPQQVSFIANQPEPFLLATRCIRDADGEWSVHDPIRGGESRELRKLLEARLDEHPGLRAWLGHVIAGDVTADDLQSLKQQAAWEIETALTIRIREQPDIHAALVAMQRALLECQKLHAPDDKWNDAIVKTQIAVEGALLEALPKQLRDQTRDRFRLRVGKNEDPDFNAQLIEQTARDLGFRTPLPTGLVKVRGGKVLFVLESGTGTVRPVLLASLFAAAAHEQHPMRRLAKSHPDILERIHQLGAWRDPASHYTRRKSGKGTKNRPTLEELKEGARTAIEITRQLLLET
jgi:hypothetical protein